MRKIEDKRDRRLLRAVDVAGFNPSWVNSDVFPQKQNAPPIAIDYKVIRVYLMPSGAYPGGGGAKGGKRAPYPPPPPPR